MFHNVVVFEVLVRNLGELGRARQKFQRGSKIGTNGMFHTIMVFVICTNERMWICIMDLWI
jgi:hypothetical protein